MTSPLAGDWNGDGIDEPGVFRPSTGQFLLLINATVIAVNFGQAGDLAVVGDWDGNGVDTPGVFNPTTGTVAIDEWFKGQNVNNSTPPVNFTFQLRIERGYPVRRRLGWRWQRCVGVYRESRPQLRF